MSYISPSQSSVHGNLKYLIFKRNTCFKAKYMFMKKTSYPSPVRAQHAWICHWWSLIEVSFKNWEISATVMHPLTSCLLAKISNPAFLRSYKSKQNCKGQFIFHMIFLFLWLNSLRMTLSGSIHVAENGLISFFLLSFYWLGNISLLISKASHSTAFPSWAFGYSVVCLSCYPLPQV